VSDEKDEFGTDAWFEDARLLLGEFYSHDMIDWEDCLRDVAVMALEWALQSDDRDGMVIEDMITRIREGMTDGRTR